MPKRDGDNARTPSAKAGRNDVTDPVDDMLAEAAAASALAPTAAEFATPAASAEPASRPKRVLVQSPQKDSPTRPRPGRSSPPALGGPRGDGGAPPPRRARAGDAPASPPPGCSTDALRIHFELVIKGFEQTVTQQAQQQADSQARITKLEKSLQRAHEELTAESKENQDKVKNEVFSLRTELSGFAAGLQEVNFANA